MSKSLDIHVLYILTKLELGGAQKVCLTLLNGINKDGFYSSLISGNAGVLVDEIKNNSSVYLLDSFKREVNLKALAQEIKTFLNICKIIKQLKKSNSNLIIHTHSTKAGILGRFAAWLCGAKLIVHTVHGYGFNDQQSFFKWIVIYFAEYLASLVTSYFVCVSKKDMESGNRLFPKFSKKGVLIRAAVDFSNFYIPAVKYKQNSIFKSFTFGTVSCFKPQKNLFDLLKAFKLVVDNIGNEVDLKLQIIGDGSLRSEIENWISEAKLEKKVQLLGWQKDVSQFMKSWDVFVMSSLWEGLPCAIVEARLMKLPVVAYSVGGISEVIFDGKNGFLINPSDVEMLARRMQQLAIDDSLWVKLTEFDDQLNDFNNEIMVAKHIQIYKNVFP